MNIKQNIFKLILSASILTLILGVSIVKAAAPFENLPDDAVLVEVLGRKVCFADIDPNSDVKKKHGGSEPNEQFNLWLKQTRAGNLSQYFRPLFDNYAKEKNLEVTQQEINQFNEKMRQLATHVNNEMKAKKDSLQKELIAENLEDSKRADLEKRFNMYNRTHENHIDPNRLYDGTQNHIAETIILNWKIYRELHNQYKGQIAFQQAGPEPIDALRRFFEEQQSKDKFKFYNKDAEDLFWNYYRSGGCNLYKDPNEAEQAINTPWWLKEEDGHYYDIDSLWSEEVNGLQIRIKAGTLRGWQIFDSNKVPSFKMDLLNTSDKTLSCIALEQFCELEIDGTWYKWTGPIAVDILSAGFKSKTVQYDFLEIKLSENWAKKETSPKNKGQTISLSPGAHTVRVKYKTMDSPKAPAIEVVSNPLKFKILPPPPAKKTDEN